MQHVIIKFVATSEIVSWDLSPSEDSYHPAHSGRLTRILFGCIWIDKDAECLHVDNEDSAQTARMRRLIRVFV